MFRYIFLIFFKVGCISFRLFDGGHTPWYSLMRHMGGTETNGNGQLAKSCRNRWKRRIRTSSTFCCSSWMTAGRFVEESLPIKNPGRCVRRPLRQADWLQGPCGVLRQHHGILIWNTKKRQDVNLADFITMYHMNNTGIQETKSSLIHRKWYHVKCDAAFLGSSSLLKCPP